MWHIWKERNALVHSQESWSKEKFWQAVIGLVSEINISTPPSNSSATTVRRISWQPPPDGWVKLNVDGSVKGDPPSSAIGGVARDPAGNWIAGFYTHVGHCSVLEAELKALRDGLSLIWVLGYCKVLVHSDSSTAVNLILSEKELFHPLGMIIADCHIMLQKSWEIELSYRLREANIVADAMAELGHDCRSGERLWPSPPSSILQLVDLDRRGNMYSRS
ncbi:unnamed protein product [Linum tenue]|uniref:RNase H type-1 domain-containing protein n=1 Tax=Linum tenue TaxID=586396 RepID=A0AAV0MFX1_9ROSI|nr:unnamed protein product [Linum tenue]